ncbi:DUF2784 family protein [Marinoscillum furvescens]|uniref:Uncharacterized protein DUF2784 n=1 Tax=Marinoscillum furvescens DSM 4134 TaxID=1122208 RepID=A0A3D9L8R3_MARFU|nr:DUF2784 family protein [Marinoscillum furvescens]REE01267.1 uncharacterized protein DUF2784 [Marinoscillum furvescens DSM 4134]
MIWLDYLLTVLHLVVILFVLLGWIHPRTRCLHRVVLLLVLVSWLLIGFIKGQLGYCLLTDWHWDIKRALGERHLPSSFIEYIVEHLTGVDFSKMVVDTATVAGLVLALVMTGVFWWKGGRRT